MPIWILDIEKFDLAFFFKKNLNSPLWFQVHDEIELYENQIFHFVKSELKELKGQGRASITDKDAKALEEKGVYLHGEQRKG